MTVDLAIYVVGQALTFGFVVVGKFRHGYPEDDEVAYRIISTAALLALFWPVLVTLLVYVVAVGWVEDEK